MRTMNTKVWLFPIILMLLVGCNSYREGKTRTVGEFTDDVAIQAAVKTRLLRDPEIKGLRVNVEVRKGVVKLFGRATSEALRDRTISLAKGVKGVVKVEDRLTIVTE